MSDLDRNMNMAIAANPGLSPEINMQEYIKMKNQILDYMIDQELIFQEAKKQNLLATNKEVDATIAEVKQNFPSDVEFQMVLKRQGFTEEKYRDLVKRVTTMRKFIDAKIKPMAKPVTEKDIADFYELHKDSFVDKERVRARHILIKVANNASAQQKAEARDKIQSILKEIKPDGSNFAELAKKYSQCPSAQQGGDLGFFTRGQMVKPFEDAAFSLQPGQISGIVETAFGYHIIQVEEKKPQRQLTLEEVSDQIMEGLSDEALDVALAEWLKPIRQKSSIKVMIKTYSVQEESTE
jgi:peptidyl-prolyl cis-trans isomerase C